MPKRGFPDSSVGKEPTCSAGDPSSIPGLGRSAGEGIGYPLQYSWASLVAQWVKNPPAMWATWVRSLGWEDPLEKGKATCSSILAWRITWTVCIVHGIAKSQTQLSDFHFTLLWEAKYNYVLEENGRIQNLPVYKYGKILGNFTNYLVYIFT